MSEEIRKEAEETVAESEETPTEAAPEFDREVLESVAENLNKTLGLKPAIDLKQDDQDLFDAIKTESAEVGIDPKTSKVSDKVVKSDRKALAPETWTFLEENGMLDHLPKEEKPAPKNGKDKPAKEKAEKTTGEGKKRGSATPGKGPGVLAAIQEILTAATAKAPIKKDAILRELVKRFPDRDESSMKNTINVQLPSRMAKEKNLDIQGSAADGFYVK